MSAPPDLLDRARAAPADAETAARLLPLVELHALGDDATEAAVERLCRRAAAAGVAAVRVRPRLVPLARERLLGSGVRVATVANFPDGSDDIARAAAEVEEGVRAGADEVGVVAPVEAVIEGDVGLVTELAQACRAACDDRALAVILETGRLAEPARIAAAARAAIMAGADALATSTGGPAPGATLEAAAVLLAVIEEADGRVGLAVAGGARTTAEAAAYLFLVDHFLGSGWTRPETLRFGDTALLDDLEATLAGAAPAPDDETD